MALKRTKTSQSMKEEASQLLRNAILDSGMLLLTAVLVITLLPLITTFSPLPRRVKVQLEVS